jgi:hypothetical protein
VNHAEILLQQDDFGRRLGHGRPGVGGNADIRGVEGRRVVDPIAQRADAIELATEPALLPSASLPGRRNT